ncbi:MAG: hypothetical protein WAM44_07900 [Chthoniobacterales bacterium]
MKKSRSVVLLITGSVVLASCQQKPGASEDMLATPTPTATPASSSSSWHYFWRSWHIHSFFGSSSFFSGILRGGFGSHGKASVAT